MNGYRYAVRYHHTYESDMVIRHLGTYAAETDDEARALFPEICRANDLERFAYISMYDVYCIELIAPDNHIIDFLLAGKYHPSLYGHDSHNGDFHNTAWGMSSADGPAYIGDLGAVLCKT